MGPRPTRFFDSFGSTQDYNPLRTIVSQDGQEGYILLMQMKYWSMALHFYQPPTQELQITETVLKSCYLPLLRTLSEKSGFGLTLNISGGLILQLKKLGVDEFFDLVKKLISDGKIEIVNSVMYHPLIPIIPKDVVVRQIKKNSQTLKSLLGVETTNGFFPPELAVDNESLNLIDSNYIFVDESSLETRLVAKRAKDSITKYGEKYLLINNREVCDLFRAYPKELHPKTVIDLVQKNCDEDGLIVTANDVELFGHHYSERLQVLSDLLNEGEIKFIKASEAVVKFGSQVRVVSNVLPSTWQDCKGFSLWNKNVLQRKYLELLKIIYELTLGDLSTTTQDLLDQGSSSCYLYWLSNWPWWHPDLVRKGAENLIKCTKNAEAEAVYRDFLDKMWEYHRSGKVEIKYKEYYEKLLATRSK